MTPLRLGRLLPIILTLALLSCHANPPHPASMTTGSTNRDSLETKHPTPTPGQALPSPTPAATATTLQELYISPNRRYFMYADGTPFFWLSDTQWDIVHKATREQADEVLADRQRKGFTAIQIPLLFHWSVSSANRYGDLPGKPDHWNEAYWQHADYIIDATIALGMHPAIFPAWGNLSGGEDNLFTPEQAYRYGQWVARRYQTRPAVVFIVGGDRTPAKDCCGITAAIAKGIKSVSPNRLVSFHSWYVSRNEGHANARWLDFSIFQTSHNQCDDGREFTNITTNLLKDWHATPKRPVIDMEPRYEHIDSGCGFKFNAAQTRASAYWAVFAGSAGMGYGQHPLWYWGQWGDNQPDFDFNRIRKHLAATFAAQAHHLKDLMLSRPYFSRVPDPVLVDNAIGVGATRGDGYLMAYAGHGQTFQLDARHLTGKTLRAWWFNPRDGSAIQGDTYQGGATHTFDPPGSEASGNDWVLVLDDQARGYGRPGRQ